MEPLRLGIIGVGQIGKQHLEEYARIEGVEVVAAADIDVPELHRVCDRFHIPHRYVRFREMLEKHPEIVAVDVCVHNNLHAPISIAALQAGKHVYCEKPIAGSYADGRAMHETARATGRMLSIQLSTLFSTETRVARRLIDAGHLGELYHARSCGFRRRGRPFVDGYGSENFVKKEVAGGGALYDMGIYHIAQLLYLLGNPTVERVSGKIEQRTEIDPGRYAISGFTVEEFATGYVRFAGGLTMDIIEVWAAHMGEIGGSRIFGSRGGICLDPLSYHTTLADAPANVTFDAVGADWRWHQLHPELQHYDSPQRHWVAALRGAVELLPTAELALTTALISEGIYLSDRLGREVTADEVREQSISTALAAE